MLYVRMNQPVRLMEESTISYPGYYNGSRGTRLSSLSSAEQVNAFALDVILSTLPSAVVHDPRNRNALREIGIGNHYQILTTAVVHSYTVSPDVIDVGDAQTNRPPNCGRQCGCARCQEMVDTLARNVLLDAEQAIALFEELTKDGETSTREILSGVVHKLCEEELGHVLEIVRFLRRYYQCRTEHTEHRVQTLLVGVEELLRYLDALVPCIPKTGCTLLVYSLVDEMFTSGADFLDLEESLQRVVNLKHSLEYVVRDVASAIAQSMSDDDRHNLAALFDQISSELLKRLVDESYADCSEGLLHVCDFVEHLPCIDHQIIACQVLYRRMNMDTGRLRVGATVLAHRIRKVMRYTDFVRAKHVGEMRKLKLKLPEGVYAITWGFVNIAGAQFMAPKAKSERIGELKCKPAGWIETCSKAAKHEFQTDDRGTSFAIKNTHTGLFLTDVDGAFCYVETTPPDRWTVEVIKRGEDVWYKITNRRTGNSLVPAGEVRVGIDDQCDGFNLVDFNERSLVVVQKFELQRKKAACNMQ